MKVEIAEKVILSLVFTSANYISIHCLLDSNRWKTDELNADEKLKQMKPFDSSLRHKFILVFTVHCHI